MSRFLAALLVLTLTLALWAPSALAASPKKGGAVESSRSGSSEKLDKSTSNTSKNDKVSGETESATEDDEACPPAEGETSPAEGPAPPADSTTPPAENTTSPADGGAPPADGDDAAGEDEDDADEDEDGDADEGEDAESKCGTHGKGLANHLEAVQKVMEKLQDKVGRLNPAAAANVQLVIDRMVAELKAAGVVGADSEAAAAVETALQSKQDPTKAELDVLAAVQEQQGKEDEASATREQRVARDPSDKDAYVALNQSLAKKGQPAEITTLVAGKKPNFDVKPFVKEGRTMVPLRAIVEALGAGVGWDAATSVVTITRGDVTVKLAIGSNTATINGKAYTLDVPAGVENGRTVIPLRFVAEMLGLKVGYYSEGRLIAITEEETVPGGTAPAPAEGSTPAEGSAPAPAEGSAPATGGGN